jgi:hypothetical protein
VATRDSSFTLVLMIESELDHHSGRWMIEGWGVKRWTLGVSFEKLPVLYAAIQKVPTV